MNISALPNNRTQKPDLMALASSTTGGENYTVGWSENGSTTSVSAPARSFVYNWDNKLRSATCDGNSISVKYDPMGNRVYKSSSAQGTRKYVVDIAGGLPTILLDINSVNGFIMKSYIYANAEILAQHDGDSAAARYFYLHDRLGSVREIIDYSGSVVNHYTYGPFGATLEEGGTLANSFMFTGQYYDFEIGQYYLRARQYDPQLMRFTGRDPVSGQFNKPMGLHKYLYCENEPINRCDTTGLWYEYIHRTFGEYGNWYGSDISKVLFDYGKFDYTHNPLLPWNTPLHFKTKKEAGKDVLAAIGKGSAGDFEDAMHMFQDTYVHRDNDYTAPLGHLGHDPDGINGNEIEYLHADRMTTYFEGLFLKSNIDFWMDNSNADLPSSNPFLSTFDSWSSESRSKGGRFGYLSPIIDAQMGGE